MPCDYCFNGSHTVREILRIITHVIIVLIFIAGGAFRWFTEPFGVYWQFFTHWSWTLQTLVYVATLIGRLWHPLFLWSVFLFFMAMFALLWFVLALVWIAISIDANFILQFTKDHGGSYGANTVLIGNSIYHTVPVLAALIFLLMYWRLLKHALHAPARKSPLHLRLAVMVYQIYSLPALITVVYWLSFDVHDIYNVDIPDWVGWIALLLICTVVNGIVYYYSLPEARKQILRRH